MTRTATPPATPRQLRPTRTRLRLDIALPPLGRLAQIRLPRVRPGLVLWHRWFGLLAGGWLLLLALTGSLLVFHAELDRALNEDLWQTPGPDPLPSAKTLVAAAEATRPGARAAYVDLPNRPGDPALVWLVAGDGRSALPPRLQVFVGGVDGRVLGERVWGAARIDRRHLAPFLYRLHMDLHGGPWMAWFLGLVGLLWAVDHLVAAVLSFPTPARWRESLRTRKGARGFPLIYGLHRAAGLWLLPVTLVVAVSGVYFEWYPTFLRAVGAVSPLTVTPAETTPELATPLASPPVDLDHAIAIARSHPGPTGSGAGIDAVSLLAAQGLYQIRLFDDRDLDPYGARQVFVDMRTGAVLADHHPAAGSAGDRLLAWQYPLHSGKAFGWPGRLAIFASGLAVAGLVVTGLIIWARKRAARKGDRRLLR